MVLTFSKNEAVADTLKIGEEYDYDTVVKSAQKFGNPDILHGSAFSRTLAKDQSFKLQRIPLSKLYAKAGKGKEERPSDVMFAEGNSEDEEYAQEYAKRYPNGGTAGPIIVMPDGDGSKFVILDGRHRARAAFLRKEKDIRAFVALTTFKQNVFAHYIIHNRPESFQPGPSFGYVVDGVKIVYDFYDHYSQESFFNALAYKDDKLVGKLNGGYYKPDDIISVKWIEVLPEARGLGVGKALYKSLLKVFKTGLIKPGSLTTDGAHLWDKVKSSIPKERIYNEDEYYKNKYGDLEKCNCELDGCPECDPKKQIKAKYEITASVVTVPKGSLLFHGSIEKFSGGLKPSGYDGIIWFADTPRIAQLYIPRSGVSMYVLPQNLTRPSKDDIIQQLQKMIGIEFDLKNVEWTSNGQLQSWGRAIGWDKPVTDEYVIEQLDKLGFEKRYDTYTIRYSGDQIFKPGENQKGRLFIAEVTEPLKIWNKSKGESDLQDLQYNDIDSFKEAKSKGLDGVLIDDFAQSEKHGNLGHASLGLFSTDKIKVKVIPAEYREWDYDDKGTPEYPNEPKMWLHKL